MFALVSIARSLYRGDAFCIYFVNINLAKRRVRDAIKMAYNRLTTIEKEGATIVACP